MVLVTAVSAMVLFVVGTKYDSTWSGFEDFLPALSLGRVVPRSSTRSVPRPSLVELTFGGAKETVFVDIASTKLTLLTRRKFGVRRFKGSSSDGVTTALSDFCFMLDLSGILFPFSASTGEEVGLTGKHMIPGLDVTGFVDHSGWSGIRACHPSRGDT